MLNWKTVALATLGTTMATSAFAADAGAPGRWTGFHVGLGVGGSFTSSKDESQYFMANNSNFANASNGIAGTSSNDGGKAGVIGTIDAGYDYQFSNQGVIGLVGNYDFGSQTVDHNADQYATSNGNSYAIHVHQATKLQNSWSLGVRAGFLPSESTLVYATGGYSRGDISQSIDMIGYNDHGEQQPFSASRSDWKSGYFIGAGIETLLSDNVSLKAEYRYTDYGTLNQEGTANPDNYSGLYYVGFHQSSKVSNQSVRAVLSYRF